MSALHNESPLSVGATDWKLRSLVVMATGLALAVMLPLCALLFKRRWRILLVVGLAGVSLVALMPAGFAERVFALQELFQPSTHLRTEDYALRGRASEALSAIEMAHLMRRLREGSA